MRRGGNDVFSCQLTKQQRTKFRTLHIGKFDTLWSGDNSRISPRNSCGGSQPVNAVWYSIPSAARDNNSDVQSLAGDMSERSQRYYNNYHATVINFTTVIVNEPLKLKTQMQPQSVKNCRGYRRSHHLGLCNRVDLGYVCWPTWSQTEADSDQTLEADAGHRRSLAIKSSQAVSNRTLAQVELFTGTVSLA